VTLDQLIPGRRVRLNGRAGPNHVHRGQVGEVVQAGPGGPIPPKWGQARSTGDYPDWAWVRFPRSPKEPDANRPLHDDFGRRAYCLADHLEPA
jgi:hypothetical protein